MQKKPPVADVDTRGQMPTHRCLQHQVPLEPVGVLNGQYWYYCPTGNAVRAWRPVFKVGE